MRLHSIRNIMNSLVFWFTNRAALKIRANMNQVILILPIKSRQGVVTPSHYIDVIMTTMASQITSLAVVYSTVYSDANQRKHQSSASLAFVWGSHRDRWNPRTKGQLRGKCFHLMTSSGSIMTAINTDMTCDCVTIIGSGVVILALL